MLYIAYGSNLNIKNMKKRCPMSKPIFEIGGKRIKFLKNWKLVFNKYANIVPDLNSSVPIGLWNITYNCETKLDKYEGFPKLYKKIYLEICSKKALVYLMNDKGFERPQKDYLIEIIQGYNDFNLDLQYLKKNLKNKVLF
tara:strand:- start:86 stop:505 length:420 start_codon:yes stop_codon:yes gene_type:complete